MLVIQTVPLPPVERAIERLRMFEPAEGYWLAFSGGKDSVCIYHLAHLAGVRFETHYNATTADPPELVRFIKEQYSEVVIGKPEINMWQLIARERRPFTRLVRYCCRALKERGGVDRVVVTGVRWAESVQRRKRGLLERQTQRQAERIVIADNTLDRRLLEHCPSGGRYVLNPIIDWTNNDVWAFIRERNLPYCSLYDEGYTRLGCVGCPMSGSRQQRRDFRRWPHFERLYLRAFEQMLEERRKHNMPTTWRTGQEVMDWWLGKQELPMFPEEMP